MVSRQHRRRRLRSCIGTLGIVACAAVQLISRPPWVPPFFGESTPSQLSGFVATLHRRGCRALHADRWPDRGCAGSPSAGNSGRSALTLRATSAAEAAAAEQQLRALQQQLGLDPAQARKMQAEVEKLLADPAKRQALEAMQQRLQGQLAGLEGDPDLQAALADVRKNGLDAMSKYEKDENIMRKFNEAAANLEQFTGAMDMPTATSGSMASGFQPGAEVQLQGLQGRPELNGQSAVVLPLTAEEQGSLKDSGRILVRLFSSGEQFAVKPDKLRIASSQAEAATMPSDTGLPPKSTGRSLQEMVGKLENLESDPELRPIVEDIRQHGMGALERYSKDDKLMARIYKAMGLVGDGSEDAS